MAPTRKTARLVAARMLSPSVRSLTFSLSEGPLAFEAGQWVELFVPTPQGEQKRAYSIASAPASEHLELAVTCVPNGVASTVLHALPVGSTLEVGGPFGLFTREPAWRASPLLLVATGTGLAPFRSLLLVWKHEVPRVPITVLFGARSEADILWREELLDLARALPELRFEVTLSRPSEAWGGRRGYVQRHVAELAGALPAPHVMICGLSHMVGEVRALCKRELGYDRKRIHSDRYD